MTSTAQADLATAPVVAMQDVTKSFPGVKALEGVDLHLRRGEVHALLGENGAGKSTLMKVLAGALRPDAGRILLDGVEVRFAGPHDARSAGIAIVHQETSLFGHLTVAENVFVGMLPRGPLGTVGSRRMRADTTGALAHLSTCINPDRRVAELGAAERQLVEIARAIAQDARVVILDEPTAALSMRESDVLFEEVRRLRSQGVCVVYISHRLEEVFGVCDRLTVLRDGRHVATLDTDETDADGVIRLMVGRTLSDLYGSPSHNFGETVLEVDHLSLDGSFRDVSFSVRGGEILGMAGLLGCGRTDVALAVFGARSPTSGTVRVHGRELRLRSPRAAMAAGIAYASEDRRASGLFADMSVERNIAVTHLDGLGRWGLVRDGRALALARDAITRLRVRTPSPHQPVRLLSGGNQQKVMLAKWVTNPLHVLIVDEPTKGVDVGAKAEIYAVLRSLAADGLAIVMISSEMTEVLGMSDRILVLREGRTAGELARAQFDEEKVLRLAAGQDGQEAR